MLKDVKGLRPGTLLQKEIKAICLAELHASSIAGLRPETFSTILASFKFAIGSHEIRNAFFSALFEFLG